jgi:two-component system, NarL family, sensor histidine kinase DesK
MADAIIKTIQETITNTLKHAHGSEISVRLNYQGKPTSSEKHIEVVITNDGCMPTEIKLGNGLRGIKERLATLKGQASFIIEGGKFKTHLIIPVAQHD